MSLFTIPEDMAAFSDHLVKNVDEMIDRQRPKLKQDLKEVIAGALHDLFAGENNIVAALFAELEGRSITIAHSALQTPITIRLNPKK